MKHKQQVAGGVDKAPHGRGFDSRRSGGPATPCVAHIEGRVGSIYARDISFAGPRGRPPSAQQGRGDLRSTEPRRQVRGPAYFALSFTLRLRAA